jgi:hypothetical protein
MSDLKQDEGKEMPPERWDGLMKALDRVQRVLGDTEIPCVDRLEVLAMASGCLMSHLLRSHLPEEEGFEEMKIKVLEAFGLDLIDALHQSLEAGKSGDVYREVEDSTPTMPSGWGAFSTFKGIH